MSGDELMVLAFSVAIGLGMWIKWYGNVLMVSPLVCTPHRRWFMFVPPVCMLILFCILKVFASFDVRDSAIYLFFYMAMGGAWVALSGLLFPVLGLSVRDDALERRNSASAIGVTGALVASTLTFAGSNIGDGPGWWVVIFCAMLSTGALLLLWLLMDMVGGIIEKIRVDRDIGAGWRLGSLLVAAGLILGRSVAGDWESADATVRDFARMGWVACVLAVCAGVVERMWPTRSSLDTNILGIDLMPAAVYMTVAVIYVVELGKW